MRPPALYFLIGPTAVGKTALAVRWACAHGAEILCADAPLVYRGMDIGTAKPTTAEQAMVPHHGLDWVDIGQRYSVGDYAAAAARVVADVLGRGRPLLVVGGSGFYLKSFFEPVTDGLEIPAPVVGEVAALWASGGATAVLAKLREVGGGDLEGLDTQNPRRVMKALERCLASGRSYRQLRAEFLARPRPYPHIPKHTVLLMRSRQDLASRIASRARMMIEGGLIEEVRQLEAQGLRQNLQVASVIGYRETLAYLSGDIDLGQLQADIVQNSLHLAAKQATFFRQLPVDEVLLLGEGESGQIEMLFA